MHQIPQEPLKRMAGTLTRWFEPIVRYIRNRYSNGMTEGFNNKIADKKYKRYFGALHARG